MVLPANCPHNVVVKYYGELQTQNESYKMKVLDIPRGGGGGGGGGGGSGHKWLVHEGEINYAHQPFVTMPQPGK